MADVRTAERRVVEEALARGFCTREQLEDARQAAAQGAGLLPTLRQRYLTPEQAQELGRVYAAALQQPTEASTVEGRPAAGLRAEPEEEPRELAGYQLQGELGRGGMGAVFRARDPQGELVALKIMHGQNPRKQARFEREAQVMRFVGRHPGVVALRDFGQSPQGLYLVMDLVDGVTLEQHMQAAADDLSGLVRLLTQVADALHFAHEAGVVHRDVKPANILVSGGGTALLTDFGVAKDLQEIERLTRTQQLVGTVAYMAPEQAAPKPDRPIDRRTDIYALGVVLYRVLARVPPYQGQPMAILGMIATTEPKAPRQVRRDVPPALEAICLRAMQKDPAERYQSAAALAVDLRRWLGEEASSDDLLPQARRRSRLGPAALLGGLILAAGAGVAGYALRAPRSEGGWVQAMGQAQRARGEERGPALEALRRAVESEPDAGPAWLLLAQAAADAGDLDDAAACLAQASAQAEASGDPRVHLLRGRVAEHRGDSGGAMAAYERALAGGLAEARSELLRLGASSARGETAEDYAWRRLAAGEGELGPLLDAGLERFDAPALVTLWEEVHRRLDPQGRPLQQVVEADKGSLLVRALGDDAPTEHRVAAVLALAMFDGSDVDNALAAIDDDASPPLLRAAAQVSRLVRAPELAGVRQVAWNAGPETVAFTRWVEGLPIEADDQGAAAAATLLQLSHRLTPEDLPSLRQLADGPSYLRRCLPVAVAISASRRAGAPYTGARGLLDQLQTDSDPRVVHQARVASQALQLLAGRGEGDPLSDDARRLAVWLVDLPWREKLTREGSVWRERLLASLADARAPDLLALRARLELEDGELAAAEATLAAALAAGPDVLLAHVLDRQRRCLAGDPEPPPLPRRLRAADPMAFERAAARVAFCRRFGVLALAGAHGASRAYVRFDQGPKAVARAVRLIAREEPGWMNMGLLVGERVIFQTRFAFSSLRRLEFRGRQDGKACNMVVEPFTGAEGSSADRMRIIPRTNSDAKIERVGRVYDRIPRGVYLRQRGVFAVTHGWTEWRVDGFGQLAARSVPRLEGGRFMPRIAFGATENTQRLQVAVFEGRWEEAPPLPPPLEVEDWSPAPPGLGLLVQGNAGKPQTLGQLRADGWKAECNGAWVAGLDSATRLRIGQRLTGPLELRARVALPPLQPSMVIGLSLRSQDSRGWLTNLTLGATGASVYSQEPSVVCFAQRSNSWTSAAAPAAKLSGSTICLSLQRVGAYVVLRAGPSWGSLRLLTPEPLYFPFEGPVDAFLLASSLQGRKGLVRFSDVELLLGR